MPSWQARILSGYARLCIRRRDWGDARALTRRARRLFGAPPVYRQLVLLGLHCKRVTSESGVRGEWIAARGPAPDVLLYVHGGGYVSCSAVTHRPITTALARLVGCRVFAAEYRTAPEAPFPAALDDVVAVYRWLLTEGRPERASLSPETLLAPLLPEARMCHWVLRQHNDAASSLQPTVAAQREHCAPRPFTHLSRLVSTRHVTLAATRGSESRAVLEKGT